MKFCILKTSINTLEALDPYQAEFLQYLERLRLQGQLVTAGTFDDQSGGMILIEAADLEQAIAIARQDPLVISGVQTYQVQGWIPTLPDQATGEDASQLPLFDASPLTAPSPEEGFHVLEADESTHEHFFTTCFVPRIIGHDNTIRRAYLNRTLGQGLRKLLLLHDQTIAGQLECAPAKLSGLPVYGESLTVIHCLWVEDAFTGLDGGRQLLAACAEGEDSASLATIAFNATLPWMPRSFFEKQGFAVVDKMDTGRFYGNLPIVAYLLWRPLQEDATPPTWDRDQLREGVDFCPAYPWLFGKRLYWGKDFSYHGMLVKEGLRRPEILSQLPILGQLLTEKWTIIKFGVPQGDLNRALAMLQTALLGEPTYYAHVYDGTQLIIVYPERIFRLGQDPCTWKEALSYGLERGIPREELTFRPCCFEEETF